MDFKNITELIEKIEKSNITNFELEEKDFKLKLEKKSIEVSQTPVPVVSSVVDNNNETIEVQAKKEEIIGNKVLAPIVGTFYASPSPESESFVKVGDTINKGDIIGIIEAMKLFNEIQSEYSGVVKEILVESGNMVEFNQPIMIIG